MRMDADKINVLLFQGAGCSAHMRTVSDAGEWLPVEERDQSYFTYTYEVARLILKAMRRAVS